MELKENTPSIESIEEALKKAYERQTVPHHLRSVPSEKFVVKGIGGHKIVNNVLYYYIHWSDNSYSWNPSYYCDQMDRMIKDYWSLFYLFHIIFIFFVFFFILYFFV